jgi:hypothetical protein
MLNCPVGPLMALPMIVSGKLHGGVLGVRPPPPTSQASIKLQFGVPNPWSDVVPGLRGV